MDVLPRCVFTATNIITPVVSSEEIKTKGADSFISGDQDINLLLLLLLFDVLMDAPGREGRCSHIR